MSWKQNQFPLVDGSLTAVEACEQPEAPLLFAPFDDDPASERTFDVRGCISGTRHRGVATVQVAGLDRFDLEEGGRRVAEQVTRVAG